MKKLFCIALILCLLPVVCLADVDLSSMTFSQLLMLRNDLTAEIMSRSEWKEVKVPAGLWRVGVDIPAGTYSVSIEEGSATFKLYTNEKKEDYDLLLVTKDSPIGRYTFSSGTLIDTYMPLIFAPPISLGF